MSEKRNFHWSDLIPGVGPHLKAAARAGKLVETLRSVDATQKLQEGIADIQTELGELVATFEQGTVQREEMNKIEDLRARLSVIYASREECMPLLRERTGRTVTDIYTLLERLERSLRHLYPDLP